MASLQISSRAAAASLLPAYRSGLTSVGCTLRASHVCTPPNSSSREDGTSRGEAALAVSMHRPGSSWARLSSGTNRFQEKRRSRASLVKTEATLDTVPSTRVTAPGESAVQWSFETEASVGRVECNSRGCRPIYDDNDDGVAPAVGSEEEEEALGFTSLETRSAVYTARRLTKDLEIRPYISFPLDFAEFLNEVWLEKTYASKYFEIALKKNPNDGKTLLQYAQFAWKALGDLEKADELFARALEELADDTDAHAIYALFLWQTDK